MSALFACLISCFSQFSISWAAHNIFLFLFFSLFLWRGFGNLQFFLNLIYPFSTSFSFPFSLSLPCFGVLLCLLCFAFVKLCFVLFSSVFALSCAVFSFILVHFSSVIINHLQFLFPILGTLSWAPHTVDSIKLFIDGGTHISKAFDTISFICCIVLIIEPIWLLDGMTFFLA